MIRSLESRPGFGALGTEMSSLRIRPRRRFAEHCQHQAGVRGYLGQRNAGAVPGDPRERHEDFTELLQRFPAHPH